MKTCIIIPTYNEARAISNIIEEIKRQGQNLEILVIDDGSSDNTAQIAKDRGATVLKNPINEGKGASLMKGFNYALRNGFDAVLTMDGDGQHSPSDIAHFIDLSNHSNSAVLIGNRMSSPRNMPWLRLATNKCMSWFISKLVKQNIPDTQCGFRLIKKDTLEKLNIKSRKYEVESEILIKASRLGFKIESLNIKSIYSGEKSQINPIVDTLRFFRFILKEIWTMQS